MLTAGSRRSSGRALNIVGPATAKCPPPERAETMSRYGQLTTCSVGLQHALCNASPMKATRKCLCPWFIVSHAYRQCSNMFRTTSQVNRKGRIELWPHPRYRIEIRKRLNQLSKIGAVNYVCGPIPRARFGLKVHPYGLTWSDQIPLGNSCRKPTWNARKSRKRYLFFARLGFTAKQLNCST